MAITTLDGVLAGLQPPRFFTKAPLTISANNRPFTLWAQAGIPGPGSYSSDLNGATLSGATSGAFQLTNGSNTYLAKLAVSSVASSAEVLLCDRLWHNGNIDETSTGSQAIVSPTWPARDVDGATAGKGIHIALEISATVGAGTPTVTVGYTNSAGTSGRTATNVQPTVASSVVTTMYNIGWQAGDIGVRSVQSIQFSATWTSGVTNLVAYRPIGVTTSITSHSHSIANVFALGLPRIYDDSVLYLTGNMVGSPSVIGLTGEVVWTQG